MVVPSPFDDWSLKDPRGKVRAIFPGFHAVAFSWVADEPLQKIRDSYLDENGMPLFPNGWIGPLSSQPESLADEWGKRPPLRT